MLCFGRNCLDHDVTISILVPHRSQFKIQLYVNISQSVIGELYGPHPHKANLPFSCMWVILEYIFFWSKFILEYDGPSLE